jgi:single-strand DNA-binding protein
MRSINRFTVAGNVGSVTSFNKAVKVSIAADRHWTNDVGKKETRTDWVTVTVFDEQAAWRCHGNAVTACQDRCDRYRG